MRLGVDPRQADQNIRTTIVLPNGNGKTVRVAVFAPLDICKAAKAAGMMVVGVHDNYFQDSQPDMRELCDRYISGFGELL